MAQQYAYLMIAIVAEVMATSLLKMTEQFTRIGPSVAVFCLYAISFYFLSLTVRTMSIGIAYAIWSGVGMVLIAVAGFILYRQTLDAAALLGIILIIAGVIVIHLYSRTIVQI